MIECRKLAKSYGGYHALKGVSFRIRPGEFAAVMGPSGCGKSTLLNLLGLLDQPSSGQYLLDGRDAASLGDYERTLLRRAHIGFVFQAFHLLSRMPVWENVALPMTYAGVGRAEAYERSAVLLKEVDLAERHLSKTPLELSGGERQRVAIARSLANGPAVILADEPTGNLDSKTGEGVLELFSKLNASGRTIVMVTHDAKIARRAEKILELRDGELVS